MNIIEINNLKVAFDNVEVVRGVDFQIKKGEIHGILGESGSGKTVTAFAIAKLHENSSYDGEILFNTESILEMNENKLSTIRGYDIAYVFQNPHEAFNPNRRLDKQLKEAMSIHGLQPDLEEIHKVLNSVGLNEPELLIKKYPYQLSGGECQRVMIGMSLLCEPQVIIADEPTSAIDASIKKQIVDLLKDINKKYGTTIILISHDMDLVENICHSMSIMYGGLVLEQGSVEKILEDPIHPYTKALIDCTNSLNDTSGRLVTLKGLPMSPDYYQDRCPFYERCSVRIESCKEGIPKMINYNYRNYRCNV